jgi:hypothetical protein
VATMQAARNDRGDALFTLMAQRHGWQAVHLEPLALLAQERIVRTSSSWVP